MLLGEARRVQQAGCGLFGGVMGLIGTRYVITGCNVDQVLERDSQNPVGQTGLRLSRWIQKSVM